MSAINDFEIRNYNFAHVFAFIGRVEIHFERIYKDMGAFWRKYILVLFIFSVALSGNALWRGFWLQFRVVEMPDDKLAKIEVGANRSKSTNNTTKNTNHHHSTKRPNKPKLKNAILLSSFMRSGSSVIGDIFNNHPESFYMFEPLHETVLLFFPITAFDWHQANS